MAVKFTNNARSTLSGSLTNSATSTSVADGSVFPTLTGSDYFYATLFDGSNNEVVKVTARSGNDLTITRAQDNTSARAFSSGDAVELRLNAALITDITGSISTAANNSTDETAYPTFVGSATGTQALETDTGLTYNPSSGILTSTQFTGAVVGNVTGTASVATAVTITDNESTNESNALIFSAGAALTGGNLGLESDGDLTYNPSTGKLTSPSFDGNGLYLTALNGTNITSGTVAAARVATLNQDTTGNAATATLATNVTITDNSNTNETMYIPLIDGLTGSQGLESDANIIYNPSTNVLTVGSSIVTTNLTGTLTGTATGLAGTPNITVGTIASGNITTTGYLRGPATFTLDPATHGDNTGTVVIAGNLQVDGTTTTVNSTTVTIEDLKLTLAEGAGSSSAANEAGIEVGVGAVGASSNPSMLYTHATTSWDMNKPLNVTGAFSASGVVTANAGVVVDNITIDGSEIDNSSGDLLLDSAGDIILDADGADIRLKDGGSQFGRLYQSSSNFVIASSIPDEDLIFQGSDDGVIVDALTFDMSAAGAATFNNKVTATELDISGNVDVDGITNLDVVDIDGAVDMASTLGVTGVATFSGTVVGNATNFDIMQNTSDASDNRRTRIGGGGDVSQSRGAFIELAGNEHTNTGDIILNAGDVSGGDIVFKTDNTTRVTIDDAGGMEITTADNADTLTLISTDADGNSGPNLRMYRNSGSPVDGDAIALIDFEGRNDNSQDVVYAAIDNRIVDASDGAESGRIEMATILAGTAGVSRVLMDATETVFNDNSKDLDFRVESDNLTNALFVQGSDGNVGIGTGSPGALLHVKDNASANDNFDVHIEGYRPNLVFEDISSSATDFQLFGDSNRLDFLYGDAATDTKLANTAMSINDSGKVGIGTTAPSGKLDVVTLATDNPVNLDVYSSNQGHVNTIAFRHSKQNTIGNTHTIVGTTIGRLEWYGNTGSAFTRAAHIGVVQGSSTETDGNMEIQAGGDIVMSAGGNVGIGDTDPDKLFCIKGDGAEIVIDDTDSTDTPRIRFRESGTTSATIHTDASALIFGTASTASAMSISDAGNVGLGHAPDATIKQYIYNNTTDHQLINAHQDNAGNTTNAVQVTQDGTGNGLYAQNNAGTNIAVYGYQNSASAGGIATRGHSVNGHGVYGATGSASMVGVAGFAAVTSNYGYLGYSTHGVYATSAYIAGALTATGTKNFRIPHGLREGYDLVHSSIEGPLTDVIYRGKVNLVDGRATVSMDTKFGMTAGTFAWLTKDIQTFTSNETGWDAVRSSFSGDTITIECQNASSTDTISWKVVAERDDPGMKSSTMTDDDGNLIVERPSEPEPPPPLPTPSPQ